MRATVSQPGRSARWRSTRVSTRLLLIATLLLGLHASATLGKSPQKRAKLTDKRARERRVKSGRTALELGAEERAEEETEWPALRLDATVPTEGHCDGDCVGGRGRYVVAEGVGHSVYHGEFVGGRPEGRGLLRSVACVLRAVAARLRDSRARGGLTASAYSHSSPPGRGPRYADNTTLEGTWAGGACRGYARWVSAGGAVYEGDLVDGVREGYGELRSVAAGTTYRGGWAANQYSGEGELTVPVDEAVGAFGQDRWLYAACIDEGNLLPCHDTSGPDLHRESLYEQQQLSVEDDSAALVQVYKGTFEGGDLNGNGSHTVRPPPGRLSPLSVLHS